MRYAFILIAALGALPGAAHAACNPQFSSAAIPVSIQGIHVGNGNSATQSFNVGIDPGDDTCAVRVRVSRLSAAPSELPAYYLTYGGNQVEILPAVAAGGTVLSDVLLEVPGGGANVDLPFAVRVPTEWGLTAGDYTDHLRVSLVGASEAVLDTVDIAVNIEVPREVSLRLVGASGEGAGPTAVPLGVLSSTSETRSAPFGVRVWSTAPYTISFTSENNGHLVHTTATTDGRIPYRIAYDLWIGGSKVNFAGGASYIGTQRPGSLGEVHPLTIVVAAVPLARAGDYSDRVWITLSAS